MAFPLIAMIRLRTSIATARRCQQSRCYCLSFFREVESRCPYVSNTREGQQRNKTGWAPGRAGFGFRLRCIPVGQALRIPGAVIILFKKPMPLAGSELAGPATNFQDARWGGPQRALKGTKREVRGSGISAGNDTPAYAWVLNDRTDGAARSGN